MTVVSEVAHLCASSVIVLAATARGSSSTSLRHALLGARQGRQDGAQPHGERRARQGSTGLASTFVAADMKENYLGQVAEADQPAELHRIGVPPSGVVEDDAAG